MSFQLHTRGYFGAGHGRGAFTLDTYHALFGFTTGLFYCDFLTDVRDVPGVWLPRSV